MAVSLEDKPIPETWASLKKRQYEERRKFLNEAFKRNRGSVDAVSFELGLSRNTLNRYRRKYGLDPDCWRSVGRRGS